MLTIRMTLIKSSSLREIFILYNYKMLRVIEKDLKSLIIHSFMSFIRKCNSFGIEKSVSLSVFSSQTDRPFTLDR